VSLSAKMKAASATLTRSKRISNPPLKKVSKILPYAGTPTVPKASLLAQQAANHARFDYQDSKRPNRAGIASTPVGRDVKNQRPLPEFKPAQIVKGGTSQARRVCPAYQLAQASLAYAQAYRDGLQAAKEEGYIEPDIAIPVVYIYKEDGQPDEYFSSDDARQAYVDGDNNCHVLASDIETRVSARIIKGVYFDTCPIVVEKVSPHNLIDTTARPALGRNQHISKLDLSTWNTKDDDCPFLPYVTIPTSVCLDAKPSSMLHADAWKKADPFIGPKNCDEDLLERLRVERIAQLDGVYRFVRRSS
jgi:hypothetical protein